MITHTPGPWHRNIRSEGEYPTIFSDRDEFTTIAVVTKMPIAAETEANIDLISAAPDMLRALKIMCNPPNTDTVWEIALGREAIAKAEGHSYSYLSNIDPIRKSDTTKEEAAKIAIEQNNNCAKPIDIDCKNCPAYAPKRAIENGEDENDCLAFVRGVAFFKKWLVRNQA
jgi:hypothetical protein